jgi:hypothetical protein
MHRVNTNFTLVMNVIQPYVDINQQVIRWFMYMIKCPLLVLENYNNL